jgi:class 3 adenylate cyclase/predicted ATPase
MSGSRASAGPDATVAGRRYMTILFCDLIGSTELAEKLDPEEMQELQHRYHDTAMNVIETFGGFVASFAGDGILAYFGYPQARENDPERAVRAALEAIDQVTRLEVTVRRERLPPLSVRIGIHTGLVVVGSERSSAGRSDHSIVGEAVNLAARLQSEAPTNSVVVSGDTLDLVEGLFEFESLGQKRIKGISRLIAVHRILIERKNTDRLRRLSRRGATRMIGRSSDLERVVRTWHKAVADSRCRIVSISGEAGVGKTRLALEICQQSELSQATVVETHCQEIFANTPFQPVASFLWAATAMSLDDSDETKLAKISEFLGYYALNKPENIAIVASLLGIRSDAAALPAQPTAMLQKEVQLNFVVSLIAEITKRNPTILWIEDAHWLDPSSSELLATIVAKLADTPLFVLMTQRTFPSRPDLPRADETVGLSQLPALQCLELAKSVPGSGALTQQDLARAVESAEGIPLFVEQLVLSLIDKGGEGISRQGLPLSLAELMSERLDRLPSGRRVVQAAACVGRSFTANFLGRLLGQTDDEVVGPLEALIAGEILKRRPEGGEDAYEFRHALLQRMAHESIAQGERRGLHSRIADLLMNDSGIGPALPEFVAHHLTEAARYGEAIQAWLGAGMSAAQRSAPVEAIDHIKRGLALIAEIADPATSRTMERALQAALIGPLTATRGSTSEEFSECCRRGLELCAEGEPTPLVFPFLFGQFLFAMGRGRTQEALNFAETFLGTAERAKYDSGRVIGYRLAGMALLGLGEAARAKQQLENSLALYDAERDAAATHLFGQNTQVHSRSLLSLALLCLGDVDQAVKIGAEALQAADSLRHPHSTAIALGYFGGWVLGWLGAPNEMMVEARRLIALADQHKLGPFRSFGTAFLGWAFCQKGDLEQGINVIEQSVREFEAIQYRMSISGHLVNLADAKRRTGKLEEADQLCRKARSWIDEGADRWLEPEIMRIEALVARDLNPKDPAKAERSIRAAIGLAQSLGFPMFELRCLDTFKDIVGDDAQFDTRAEELSRYRNLDRLAANALRPRGSLSVR